jgi:hypothetical protein
MTTHYKCNNCECVFDSPDAEAEATAHTDRCFNSESPAGGRYSAFTPSLADAIDPPMPNAEPVIPPVIPPVVPSVVPSESPEAPTE